jgi:soluble lytic murein transglycosylase
MRLYLYIISLVVLGLLISECASAVSRAKYCGVLWGGEEKIVQLAETIAKEKEVDSVVVMAIIEVESNWNSQAKSSAGAVGLMQLMSGAVIDAEKYCGLSPARRNLYDPAVNILLGTCYLARLQESTSNLVETLAIYNGGYRQLSNLRSGKKVATETTNYVMQVLWRMAQCGNY